MSKRLRSPCCARHACMCAARAQAVLGMSDPAKVKTVHHRLGRYDIRDAAAATKLLLASLGIFDEPSGSAEPGLAGQPAASWTAAGDSRLLGLW